MEMYDDDIAEPNEDGDYYRPHYEVRLEVIDNETNTKHYCIQGLEYPGAMGNLLGYMTEGMLRRLGMEDQWHG